MKDEIDYKTVASWLYYILDDIDSVGDFAKGDDKVYRETVERLHRLKSEVGCSPDGYILEFRNPEQQYGLTRLFSSNKSVE